MAPVAIWRYRWEVVLSLFGTLLTLAMIAIPIVIVAKIVRRVREVSSRLGDPARLQRVFAQTAAAALRRAGADPEAVAKVERLGQDLAGQGPAQDRVSQARAVAYETRIGLQRKGGWATRPEAPAAPVSPALVDDEVRPLQPAPPPPEPLPPPARLRAAGHALHRPPRLRPRHQPVAPLGGFDMGDRFRLSEPPDISEAHGPMSLDANWLALVALLGGAAYYFLR